MKILTASHVLPISGEAIPDGAVAISENLIEAVGSFQLLSKQYPTATVEDFGNAVILPGFVNCHSHLEISGMRGMLDHVEHNFKSWLLELNGIRSRMTETEIADSAEAGAVEGARAGVTCFGDIGRHAAAGLKALKSVGLRGVVFQETDFSPDDRTAAEDFRKLEAKFSSLRKEETSLVSVGLSPHAPYTVSRSLFERIAEHAIAQDLKVSIHASESAEEQNLLENGEGFFTEIYKKFGLEWNSPRSTSIQFLKSTGILRTRPLLAHCVNVTDTDIELIADNDARIAHCPKSNAKFGHGIAPLDKFIGRGIRVGLGSDSIASNNICDLFEESRFAALLSRVRKGRRHFTSAREALELATIGGARALGLDDKIGTLKAGSHADITVISLDSPSQQPVNDIYAALVFSSNSNDVIITMVAGKEIFRRER